VIDNLKYFHNLNGKIITNSNEYYSPTKNVHYEYSSSGKKLPFYKKE
jgi:hypothetical protein